MLSEEELKCEDGIWSFDCINKFASASFYKWKKKRKIGTNSCKEILIRSGHCKSLLNQRYMLFVINKNLNVFIFQFFPDSWT